MPKVPSRSTPANRTKQVQVAERTAQALEMRRLGMSYEAIGDAIGVSRTRAFELVKGGLQKTIQVPGDALRAQAVAELERVKSAALAILESFNPLVSAGSVVTQEVTDPVTGEPMPHPVTGKPWFLPLVDRGPALSALKLYLSANESWRKLVGVDAPKTDKLEVSHPAGDGMAALLADPDRAAAAVAEGMRRFTRQPIDLGTVDVVATEPQRAQRP